jgi:Outer membrane receptor proteins, mostly Fe transport
MDKVTLVRCRAGLPKAIGNIVVVIALFAGGALGDDQQKAEDGTVLSLADLYNMDVYGVSKKKETANESPMSIYVMSRSDMQTWGVRNTFEALGRTPGISFYNTDVYGQNGVLVRGMGEIWRVGYAIELMPQLDWGASLLSTNFLKNMEVARGPAGLTWGGCAQAGLVNLNIRDDLNGGLGSVEYGEANRQVYEYMYGKKLPDGKEGDNFFVGYHIEGQDAVNRDNSTSAIGGVWKENGFYDSQKLLAKIQYNGFKALFSYEDPRKLAPHTWFQSQSIADHIDSFTTVDKGFGDELKTMAFRMEYKLPVKGVDLTIYNNYLLKDWSLMPILRDEPEYTFYGFNGEVFLLDNKLDVNFGGDVYGMSDMRGEWQHSWGVDSAGLENGGTNYWKNGQLFDQTSNLFVQARYIVTDKFSALIGGRIDYEHLYGPAMRQPDIDTTRNPADTTYGQDKVRVNLSGPRIGLFYKINPGLSVKYAFNRSFRPPNGNEVYFSPGLKTELNMANEITLSMNKVNKFVADLTMYDQRMTDAIVRDPMGFNTFTNAGSIVSDGVELVLKYFPVRGLVVYTNSSLCMSGTTQRNFVTNADTTFATPFQPLVTGIFGATYDLMDKAKLSADVRTNLDIPYTKLDNTSGRANVTFADVSIQSHRIFKERLDLSFVALNIFNNKIGVSKGAPCFGEHAQDANGTMTPEGRKTYVKANVYF